MSIQSVRILNILWQSLFYNFINHMHFRGGYANRLCRINPLVLLNKKRI